MNLGTFGCTFTGLNSAVVYQNWQLSVMITCHAQCATWFNWYYTQSEPNLLLFFDGVQNWKHHWSTAFLNRQILAYIYREGICGIILDFEPIYNPFTMTNYPKLFFHYNHMIRPIYILWLISHYEKIYCNSLAHSIVQILASCITSHKHLVSMAQSTKSIIFRPC